MPFNRANFRVALAWEFDMNERLLFIHDNRTSTERVNISPHITSRKKLIDFWNGMKVGTRNTRDKIIFFYDAAEFGNFLYKTFGI